MKSFFTLLSCVLLAVTDIARAQEWSRIESLPPNEFYAMEIIDGTIYTASGNTLYRSSDAGATWQESLFTNEEVFVSCLAKFNNRLYAGTSMGVFSSPMASVHQLWNHDIHTVTITSFAEHDNALYASILGFGVMKLMNNTAWMGFSNGIPEYSMEVSKLVSTPGGLLAMAGANGTFYRYNTGMGIWEEDYYFDGLSPAMHADDVVVLGNTLYVSRYNKVLRSDDLGENWVHDQDGLPGGQNRVMHKGQVYLYSITTASESLTKINKRGLNAADTNWGETEILPFYTFALRELGTKKFIAAYDGVYFTDGTMDTGYPVTGAQRTVLYPNPSADGNFMLKSMLPIDGVKVFDIAGRLISSTDHPAENHNFTISSGGLYLVEITAETTVETHKVVVK